MKHLQTVCLLLALSLAVASSLTACGQQRTTVFPQGEKVKEGVWNLKYMLKLDIPERNFSLSFTGVMRLDLATQTALVAGVGNFGLQLFAMRITPSEATVEYEHPMMNKIPRASMYIASCVRTIWFNYLPQIQLNTPIRQGDVFLAATGDRAAGLWSERVRYEDREVPFSLNVRLLQAQQEN